MPKEILVPHGDCWVAPDCHRVGNASRAREHARGKVCSAASGRSKIQTSAKHDHTLFRSFQQELVPSFSLSLSHTHIHTETHRDALFPLFVSVSLCLCLSLCLCPLSSPAPPIRTHCVCFRGDSREPRKKFASAVSRARARARKRERERAEAA